MAERESESGDPHPEEGFEDVQNVPFKNLHEGDILELTFQPGSGKFEIRVTVNKVVINQELDGSNKRRHWLEVRGESLDLDPERFPKRFRGRIVDPTGRGTSTYGEPSPQPEPEVGVNRLVDIEQLQYSNFRTSTRSIFQDSSRLLPRARSRVTTIQAVNLGLTRKLRIKRGQSPPTPPST